MSEDTVTIENYVLDIDAQQELEKDEKIPSPNKFSIMIERTAKKEGLTYLDTIVDYCERTGIEIEDVACLVNRSLKEKMEVEAMQLNLLKEKNTTATLPL